MQVEMPVLDLPAADAPREDLRAHFIRARDLQASVAYDTAVTMCITCCREGENVYGKQGSRSGRARFCSEECEAIHERFYGRGAQAATVVEAAPDGPADEGEDDNMAAKTKTAKRARGAPAKRQARERTAVKPTTRERRPAGEAIDPETLRPGMKLRATYKGAEVKATVVDQGGAHGIGIRYEGTTYGSLSSAAKAVTGGAVNGRKFWTVVA